MVPTNKHLDRLRKSVVKIEKNLEAARLNYEKVQCGRPEMAKKVIKARNRYRSTEGNLRVAKDKLKAAIEEQCNEAEEADEIYRNDLDKILKAKNAEIVAKDAEIMRQNRELRAKNRELRAKDAEIRSLRNTNRRAQHPQLPRRDGNRRYEHEIARLEGANKILQKDFGKMYYAKEDAIQEKRDEIANLKRLLEEGKGREANLERLLKRRNEGSLPFVSGPSVPDGDGRDGRGYQYVKSEPLEQEEN